MKASIKLDLISGSVPSMAKLTHCFVKIGTVTSLGLLSFRIVISFQVKKCKNLLTIFAHMGIHATSQEQGSPHIHVELTFKVHVTLKPFWFQRYEEGRPVCGIVFLEIGVEQLDDFVY